MYSLSLSLSLSLTTTNTQQPTTTTNSSTTRTTTTQIRMKRWDEKGIFEWKTFVYEYSFPIIYVSGCMSFLNYVLYPLSSDCSQSI